MTKNLLTAVVLLLAGTLFASAADKTSYGKPLTLKERTKISAILADPAKFNGKRLQVEGPIVGVCEKRGCWIMIAGDQEKQSLRFKVDDGVIVFPMEIKGQNAVAEGVLSVTTVSTETLIEQGKKHAKESGEEFDPASVTGPKTVIMLKGEGAVVAKK